MIKINFITLEAGWIKGEIVTEEKKMYFDYSWISNFLNDLLKATLSIGGYIEGMNREKFTAYWEPAIDDWLLYKKENNLIIQINCFEDETRKKQIETIKTTSKRRGFLCGYKPLLLARVSRRCFHFAQAIAFDSRYPSKGFFLLPFLFLFFLLLCNSLFFKWIPVFLHT